MPYSKIQEYGIKMEGLPGNLPLKNPTAYGKVTLQEIIANKDTLKLHGNLCSDVLIYVIMNLFIKHTYHIVQIFDRGILTALTLS